jgi:hypothetical protein
VCPENRIKMSSLAREKRFRARAAFCVTPISNACISRGGGTSRPHSQCFTGHGRVQMRDSLRDFGSDWQWAAQWAARFTATG